MPLFQGLSSFSAPFTAAAAINDFYGQWANTDPTASGVHSVSIWHSEEGLQIHVFCHILTSLLLPKFASIAAIVVAPLISG